MSNDPIIKNRFTLDGVSETKGNHLFPIFLKLEGQSLLLIGGGNVALEKLEKLTANAPRCQIHLIAEKIAPECKLFIENQKISFEERAYQSEDISGYKFAIVATNNALLNDQIREEANTLGVLLNVADKPELCDFYLGAIAGKGNLKIAISTNGKSPTIAKRLKEIFNEALPSELDQSLLQMEQLRQQLKGDFTSKVQKLNSVSEVLIQQETQPTATVKPTKSIAKRSVSSIIFRSGMTLLFLAIAMILGHYILGKYLSAEQWVHISNFIDTSFTGNFWILFTVGFLAQLIDGAMGMGYGALSTTFLMTSSAGLPIAGISSSVHMAEMFSVGTAGISHYKYKHVNKKLWKALVIPGILGSISGAIFIGLMGQKLGIYLRPIIAFYTLFLGYNILRKAFIRKPKTHIHKITKVFPVALIGGFLDAFGGGWGPLVTSTLISGGRSPIYAIGSSTFTKFFTSIASTATFIFVFHQLHLEVILGLILGGILAAPFAAKLSGKLPKKAMLICVGILVMLCSLRIITKLFF